MMLSRPEGSRTGDRDVIQGRDYSMWCFSSPSLLPFLLNVRNQKDRSAICTIYSHEKRPSEGGVKTGGL